MELDDVMRTTFAAREYTGEEVSDEALFRMLDNARFAPSGGNRQGNRVILVRDLDTRRQLADLVAYASRRYMAQIAKGESPWNSVTPSKVTAADVAAAEQRPGRRGAFLTASVVLVFLVDLRVVASMDKELDRVGVISGASIYPFVWNVLLQARQAGFGGVITTGLAAKEPEAQALLGIPAHFAIAAAVPIGRPVRQLTKLTRLPVEDIATRERFDGQPFTV